MEDDPMRRRRADEALVYDRAKVLIHEADPANNAGNILAEPLTRAYWLHEAIRSLQREELLPGDFVLGM